MFQLSKKIRSEIGETFFKRWIDYFKKWKVNSISFIEIDTEFIFSASVVWNYDDYDDYDAGIRIMRKNWNVIWNCDCMAFYENDSCKHIWALSLQIENDYVISSDLDIVFKKWDDLLAPQENKSSLSTWEDAIFKKIWAKIAKSVPRIAPIAAPEIKRVNPILNLLKYNTNNLEDNNDLYKIKLEFENTHNGDIEICLFECKRLKNWKISTWTRVYNPRYWNLLLPEKYKKLIPFIREAKWYYYKSHLTFNRAPSLFLNTIREFDHITTIGNSEIEWFKHDCNFFIKIEKLSSNDYVLKWVLILDDWRNIFIEWHNFIWDYVNNRFAIFTSDNLLLFFTSNLSRELIKKLSTDDISLDQWYLDELKSSNKFDILLDNALEIESSGIEIVERDPKENITIKIWDCFDTISVSFSLKYDDINSINLFDEKKYLKDLDWNIIRRNFANEKAKFDALNDFWDLFDYRDEESFNFVKNVDDNIDHVFEQIDKLIENWFSVSYLQSAKRIANHSLNISLKVKSDIDWFDTELEVEYWWNKIDEFDIILEALETGKKYVTLKNWTTFSLKDNFKSLPKQIDALWLDRKKLWEKQKISRHNIWLLENKHWEGELFYDLDKNILKIKKELLNFEWITEHKISKNLKAILRDYQLDWFNWLNFLRKYNFWWILADDMWLWKTVQAIAILAKIYSEENIKEPSIVVCPTSLTFNWIDELEKFAPSIKVDYIANWKDWFSKLKKNVQIIVISYWLMSNIIERWNIPSDFHYVVLDEAQNIKNANSKRAKNIFNIRWKYRLALSWTPVENNLFDLWSIFNFLMPWFLWNQAHFKERYMKWNEESLKILSSKVKPFVLRRTKDKVLKELPPKVEEVIYLEMWRKQQEFYNRLKNTYKSEILKKVEEEGINKSRFAVLDALLKMRQACLMPELVNLKWNNLQDSIKIKYLDENIEEMTQSWHNILIFSQFTWFLKYVRSLLDKKKINFNYLDWGTKPLDRKKLVWSFNAWDVNVFIISLKAWWTWLNLIAADYVIHLDPWWNPAVENQATDRAHRIWQKKTVFVQKLIVKNGIEEKILKLQESKKKLIDNVFSWDFTWSFNEKDLKFIFE